MDALSASAPEFIVKESLLWYVNVSYAFIVTQRSSENMRQRDKVSPNM